MGSLDAIECLGSFIISSSIQQGVFDVVSALAEQSDVWKVRSVDACTQLATIERRVLVLRKYLLLARSPHTEGHVEVVDQHRGEENEADISIVCWQGQRCGGHFGDAANSSVNFSVAIQFGMRINSGRFPLQAGKLREAATATRCSLSFQTRHIAPLGQ